MRLLIVGYGKMGRLVEELAVAQGMEIASRIDVDDGDWSTPADVAIDFSTAAALETSFPRYVERRLPAVLGTTGWSELEPAYRAAAERVGLGVVASAYFSIGVNLFELIELQIGIDDGEQVAGLRLFLWTSVVVLLGMGAYGVFGPASPDRSTLDALGGVAFLLVFAAVCAGYFYGKKIGIAQKKQEASFVLTDKDLVLKREGWPDGRVALASISLLTEGPEGMQVAGSDDPYLRMIVPRDIEGYVLLRDELAKHHAVTSASPSSQASRMLKSGLGLGLVLLVMASFYSKQPRAILIAFGCYLAWFIGSSLYMAARKG